MYPMDMIIRLISIVFSFTFLTAVISYTFSKRIFTRILMDTYLGEDIEGYRVDIKTKMLIQINTHDYSTILLISLLGYSQVIEEKGNIIFETYKTQLNEKLKDPNYIKRF